MMCVMVGLVAIALMAADAQAFRITTAHGGADAELRESGPTTNRGDNSEIASRVASNRNSCIYLKFDVSTITAADLADDITVRTTYRNNNLVESRFYNPEFGYTGWDYFVLDPTMEGANWDEMTITPENAPGYTYDGLYETKGQYTVDPFEGAVLNDGLTYLGQQLYSSAGMVGTTSHLPVGGAFDFTLGAGSALHDAIIAAQATDHKMLTIIMGIAHDYVEGETPSQWVNFNYLFNPKEMTTLNSDPDSPWSGMANDASNDYFFSPTLLHIPEPATMVLLGLGGLLLGRKRK